MVKEWFTTPKQNLIYLHVSFQYPFPFNGCELGWSGYLILYLDMAMPDITNAYLMRIWFAENLSPLIWLFAFFFTPGEDIVPKNNISKSWVEKSNNLSGFNDVFLLVTNPLSKVKVLLKNVHPLVFSQRGLEHYCTFICLRWSGIVNTWPVTWNWKTSFVMALQLVVWYCDRRYFPHQKN